jgi:hypothetical protein
MRRFDSDPRLQVKFRLFFARSLSKNLIVVAQFFSFRAWWPTSPHFRTSWADANRSLALRRKMMNGSMPGA